jgi:hypothetical protein
LIISFSINQNLILFIQNRQSVRFFLFCELVERLVQTSSALQDIRKPMGVVGYETKIVEALLQKL